MMIKLNRDFLDKHSIKAAIFDMDGLLIDSEPLWQEAEMEVFKSVGVSLSQKMTIETMGLRVDELVNYWFSRYPWNNTSKSQVADMIIDKVISLIRERGESLPGVNKTLDFFITEKLPIAIASSSALKIIDAVLERLSIRNYFSLISSAQSEKYGKPHPAVFITASTKLDIAPSNCLVFEDSINGMIAAKAAKMKCVGIPNKDIRGDIRTCIADFVVDSLEDLH